MSRFGPLDPWYRKMEADIAEDRMRRVLAVDVRYTHCAEQAPIAAGEYEVDGKRVVIAEFESWTDARTGELLMQRTGAQTDYHDPGDEDRT